MGKNILFSFFRKFFFEKFSPKFNVSSLKFLMNLFYVYIEKISYHFEILYSNYLLLYDELIDKEIDLAKIKSSDKVLVVGCGSLPATCILVARKTNAKTHGIDIDSIAIKKSTRFIKKIKLENLLDFEIADGVHYDYSTYDVIFALYGINKHRDILINLSKKISQNTRVIYRSAEDVKDKITETGETLSDYFTVKDSIKSDVIYLNRSYLLTVKK